MTLIGRSVTNIKHYMNINTIANGFHTSSTRQLDQEWRREKRLTKNPTKFGPLTNLPDYSFVDGRPSPFGSRQFLRIKKQREVLTKVKRLVYEIDYAIERYARIQDENAQDKKRIIESKLKPKGQYLLSESCTNTIK